MSPFYANYRFHPQTEWMREREAQYPGAGLYTYWMQVTHQLLGVAGKVTYDTGLGLMLDWSF